MKTLLAAVSLVLLAPLSQAQNANHIYRLDGSLADDLGGPALIAHGGNLGAVAYSFGPNQGLELVPNLGGEYTIDLSFHFDSQGEWQKIIDFSNLSADAGLYRQGDLWSFFPVVASGPVLAGVDARLTVTRDSAGTLRVYGDGALVHTVDDQAGLADFGSSPAYFFIDDFGTSQREASPGQVHYIRTYASALDAAQVANLGNLPAVPEPASLLLMLAGLAGLTAWRARPQRR